MKKKTGYTLIEIMVVVASISLIMTAVVGVVLGTFRTQNRTQSDNKISDNGSWIINELRKNSFNSYDNKTECSSDNLSVKLKDMTNGETTTLSCNVSADKIASTSATAEKVLNNNEVKVLDCRKFVTCEKTGDEVSALVFNFVLGATTGGVGSSQVFSTRVTLRN